MRQTNSPIADGTAVTRVAINGRSKDQSLIVCSSAKLANRAFRGNLRRYYRLFTSGPMANGSADNLEERRILPVVSVRRHFV